MKYMAVVAGAVLVGLHWQSRLGWFTLTIITIFIINILIDIENERNKKKGN
jgi:hypothetical protein